MSEPDRQPPGIDSRLAELAEVAGRAVVRPPVGAIRRRAHRRTLRRAATAGGLAALLLVVGGVGTGFLLPSRPPAPPSTTTQPTTTPPSPAPSSVAPTPTAPVTPSTQTQSTPFCRKADLKVSRRATEAGSGHRAVILVFTNTGAGPCRTRGYPGVAGLDRDGNQVAQAERTRSGYLGGLGADTKAPTVTLSPGQSASATVEATAFDPATGNGCTPYAGLLVTVPDDTASTQVPWTNDGCTGLEVHPVVPGTSGSAR
ncbi:DUF4232 domain-containing protein [Micromonospora sp. NBC_01796]|uniref:DUF4232 domain-containing protein n=1 Tax=Micromonospora sp. NBC_01796 TaxID=2975987 RepID=UPI002DD8D6B0|nr:DUF4232 domain-containing protein [Micromonospora sp. NBC_01796]WSA87432.1 DUF4232 domain-containing protein [Micromonospora sp. NBC_01796]